MNTVIPAVLCAILYTAASAHGQDISRDKMDIAGIKIGMTETEVMQAIKTFDASASLSNRYIANYPYNDGVNYFDTPDFLQHLTFQTSDSGFAVWFASPPAESRVYAVSRRSSTQNPPTSDQFIAALTAKYGAASAISPSNSGQKFVQWHEQGKPACTVIKDKSGNMIPDNNSTGTLRPPNAVTLLEQQAKLRYRRLIDALGPSVDVARCGTVLHYEWIGDVVKNFEVHLVDQGGMVTLNRKSSEWVEELENEAVRKRQAQGAAPKL